MTESLTIPEFSLVLAYALLALLAVVAFISDTPLARSFERTWAGMVALPRRVVETLRRRRARQTRDLEDAFFMGVTMRYIDEDAGRHRAAHQANTYRSPSALAREFTAGYLSAIFVVHGGVERTPRRLRIFEGALVQHMEKRERELGPDFGVRR